MVNVQMQSARRNDRRDRRPGRDARRFVFDLRKLASGHDFGAPGRSGDPCRLGAEVVDRALDCLHVG